MDFRKKKEIARRIAKVQHIPTYREMLRARGSMDAGRVMPDKTALARSLVYNLLDFYTEEQILATVSTTPAEAPHQPAAAPAGSRSSKKKIQRLKNILPSHGRIWTTLWSGLQTAYTRTASTATALWRRLKETLKGLMSSIVKHLPR